jgi:host factor-I protein
MVNRKLVRPRLAEVKERFQSSRSASGHDHTPREVPNNGASRRRAAPPEQTNAEAFYYLKQMNTQVPMVVVLEGGEELTGHIEWYDRACLKVHREGAPNLLVFKHAIKYLFKEEDR